MKKKYQIEERAEDNRAIGVLTFHDTLGVDEAEALYREINGLLQKQCRDWIVCLDGLSFCDSIMMSIWVSLHAMVRKFSGTIGFKVRRDSHIHRQMLMSQLNLVLSVQAD